MAALAQCPSLLTSHSRKLSIDLNAAVAANIPNILRVEFEDTFTIAETGEV